MPYILLLACFFYSFLGAQDELPPANYQDLKNAFDQGDYQHLDSDFKSALLQGQDKQKILELKLEWELLRGDFEAANSILTSIQTQVDYTLYLAYRIKLGLGDLAQVEQYVNSLSAEQKESSAGLAVAYKWAILRGKYELAEGFLNSLDDKFDSVKDMNAEDHFFRAQVLQDDDPAEAYKAYQRAYKKAPKRYHYRILAAHHCARYYAMNYANEEFANVLKENPNHPDALAGLAELKFQNNDLDTAHELAVSVMRWAPHHALAMQVISNIFSIKGADDQARTYLSRALSKNKNNMALLAQWAALEDIVDNPQKRDDLLNEIWLINPKYAEAFIVMAENCERNHFLERAATWAQKAIDMRPYFWAGYYSRGVSLLRLGEEREGYDLVDKAFEMNGFNFWAKNMLVLLDRDFRKKEYVLYETDHYVVKMHKDEAAIMGDYVKDIVEKAWDKYTKKYNFIPKGPRAYDRKVLFLLFKTHNDFSVRTVGLPGLGAGGATFGQVITMPSPKAMHRDEYREFNWVRVFEHEFVHVLTLQMSDYHIPRWLTEGISTWEEEDFDLQYDRTIRDALYNGRLPDLYSMNDGFMQQQYPGQMAVSYYQSALFTKFYTEKYGFDALRKAIELMAKQDCVESLAEASAVKSAQLNEQFADFQAQWIAGIPWPLSADKVDEEEGGDIKALFGKLVFYQDLNKAQKVNDMNDLEFELYLDGLLAKDEKGLAEKIVRSRESYIARGLEVLGSYYLKQSQQEKAYKYFEDSISLGGGFLSYYYTGLKANADKDVKKATEYLSKAVELYPRYTHKEKNKNPYEILISLHTSAGDQEKAMEYAKAQYEANSKLFSAALSYAKILEGDDKLQEARKALVRANEINPYDHEIHVLSGALLMKLEKPHEALLEYTVASELEPRDRASLEGAMKAALASGKKLKAQGFARRLKRFYKDAEIPDGLN